MKVSPELPPRLPPPLLDVILCGGFAGGIADTALHGMDTIKTRMQTSHRYSRSGLMATIRIIVAEEGPRALFGGLGPAMTGSLVSTMVYFASYER